MVIFSTGTQFIVAQIKSGFSKSGVIFKRNQLKESLLISPEERFDLLVILTAHFWVILWELYLEHYHSTITETWTQSNETQNLRTLTRPARLVTAQWAGAVAVPSRRQSGKHTGGLAASNGVSCACAVTPPSPLLAFPAISTILPPNDKEKNTEFLAQHNLLLVTGSVWPWFWPIAREWSYLLLVKGTCWGVLCVPNMTKVRIGNSHQPSLH